MGRASQFIWYINQDIHQTHGAGSGWARWKKDNITHFNPDEPSISRVRRKYRQGLEMDKLKFLNKKTGLRSHYWDESKQDTLCRMYSTGGITKKHKYEVSEKNTCKSTCTMCQSAYKELMQLTEEILELAKSDNGGWSQNQLNLIGVDWQPERGWKSNIVGKVYPKKVLSEFVSLKNKHL
jgi:hypothetical protein